MSERMTSLDEWNDSDFVRNFQLAEDVILELQDRIAELEAEYTDLWRTWVNERAELEATIEKVEALIPDWREYALDGTLGSSAVDCADDLEVALGDKV